MGSRLQLHEVKVRDGEGVERMPKAVTLMVLTRQTSAMPQDWPRRSVFGMKPAQRNEMKKIKKFKKACLIFAAGDLCDFLSG